MKETIRAVIFDFGGVLSLQPDERKIQELCENCNLDRGQFEQIYRKNRHDFDRGTLTAAEYWSGILQAGGVQSSSTAEACFHKDIELWTVINKQVLEWSRLLKREGYITAVLSNMPREILDHIVSMHTWIFEFDIRVFSCDHGLVKPEPQIYQTCLMELKVAPEEVLFIDDNIENTEAAERLGLHALTFQSMEKAGEILEQRYGLPILPGRS